MVTANKPTPQQPIHQDTSLLTSFRTDALVYQQVGC